MKSIDLLRSMDIFAQVSEGDLQKIAALLKEKQVNRDAVVFRQGDAGDALYVVLSGRIQGVASDAAGREKVLGIFSEGQPFGEMALLTGEPYPATMQAVTDARLLLLRKEDFDLFLAHNVQVMLQTMKVVAQRQAATSQRMAAASQQQAVVTEGRVAIAEEFGQEAEDSGPAGKLFTVFSPKGGVGKSTLAVNLAVTLAQQHPDSVALLDLSLTFGHAALFLNLTPKTSLSATNVEALRGMGVEDGLAYYMAVHPTSGLRLLTGATRPEEGETVSGDMAKAAIELLRRHFAYVVVDTESCFSDPVLAALESSDKILMLCSPEISSLRDTRECQRILNEVVHIPGDRLLYLLNHLFPFKMLSKEQFESGLQQELFAELPYGGEVPARAALRGEILVESQPGSNLARAVQRLATQVAAEDAKVAADSDHDKRRGFFR